MKESYVEGLASYDGPESCADVREDVCEALTGVRTGRVLSREIHALGRESGFSGVPRRWRHAEGHTVVSRNGEAETDPARSETPSTYGNISHGNREIPRPAGARRQAGIAARIEKPSGVRR